MNQSKKTGIEALNDSEINKSTAFTSAERDELGLRGLLPWATCEQSTQVRRVLANIERKAYDIERYVLLNALHDRNQRLFYRVLIDHVEQMMPLVYTPTVGEACKEFAHIFRTSRGFYITPDDRGQIESMLGNWPHRDIRVIVITDGQRILGLGDLGANGMGIPIGKLDLYTALAGIAPQHCLPVMFDVGTGNQELLQDPLYLGYPHSRLEGDEYDTLMEEFITAVEKVFPKALVQFEDFLTPNAYALLGRYRKRILSFNDDIQGTAAVALAGVYSATQITGDDYRDLTIMFLGAGSAATGIGDLMTQAFMSEGLSEAEARRRLWFVDVAGLVVQDRSDLAPHNLPYAHDHAPATFVEAMRDLKPQVLIGATGHPGTFTKEVLEIMAANNERPVVFALSNPTSKAECTAAQAYEWTNGRVVFASGSPFPSIDLGGGKTWRPGQGNNAYIFPGIGLGAMGCEATGISDTMFLAAARTLADQVSEDDLAEVALYPKLTEIREVSLAIATAVAERAYDEGLATLPRPKALREFLAGLQYEPTY